MTIVYRPYRPKRAKKRPAQATMITSPTIVRAKNPRRAFPDVPDMTPEEHKRRGDAADALFRDMKRQIAEKLRGDQ